MEAADGLLPEPWFKGAARVLKELPVAALPWEEGGGPAAPTEFAAPAEACAGLEMTARLLAALPEFIARLPARYSGWLAHHLWGAVCSGTRCIVQEALVREAPQQDGAAAAAAGADLLASAAELAGAAAKYWRCISCFDSPLRLLTLCLTL